MGKEWLARGTAVYGGGSAIDVPVAIAGDSFYYVPSHEINAGAAVIAYKMQPGGSGGRPRRLRRRSPRPTSGERSRAPLGLGHPGHAAAEPRAGGPARQGARHADQPLLAEAAATVAKIPDAELERFIREAAAQHGRGRGQGPGERPRRAVRESDPAQDWQLAAIPRRQGPARPIASSSSPPRPSKSWHDATRTWMPACGSRLTYVARMTAAGKPLAVGTGERTFPPDQGENREAYDLPPRRLLRSHGRPGPRLRPPGSIRSGSGRHASGDWGKIRRDWPQLRGLADQPPGKIEEDCGNGHAAGLIAFCRMAKHLDDEAALQPGVAKARAVLRQRLQYEFAYPRGGLIAAVPASRSIFARWREFDARDRPIVLGLCAGDTSPPDGRLR